MLCGSHARLKPSSMPGSCFKQQKWTMQAKTANMQASTCSAEPHRAFPLILFHLQAGGEGAAKAQEAPLSLMLHLDLLPPAPVILDHLPACDPLHQAP